MRINSYKAFSIVELMIVVGIIAIISALAVNSVRNFKAKAAQAEAKTYLKHIFNLQQVYINEHNESAEMLDGLGRDLFAPTLFLCDVDAYRAYPWQSARNLGFNIPNCGKNNLPRYLYISGRLNFFRERFTGRAASMIICPWLTFPYEQWEMDETGVLDDSFDCTKL